MLQLNHSIMQPWRRKQSVQASCLAPRDLALSGLIAGQLISAFQFSMHFCSILQQMCTSCDAVRVTVSTDQRTLRQALSLSHSGSARRRPSRAGLKKMKRRRHEVSTYVMYCMPSSSAKSNLYQNSSDRSSGTCATRRHLQFTLR